MLPTIARRFLSATASREPLVWAHVKGASDPPLDKRTIGDWFEDQRKKYTTMKALTSVEQNQSLSWDDLGDQVDRLAMGLHRLGLHKGDRLGIWLPNCTEWIVTHLATAKLGIILVNLNPAYRAHELEHAINLSGLKTLLLTPQIKSSDYLDIVSQIAPEAFTSKAGSWHSNKVPSLRHIIHNSHTERNPGLLSFWDLIDPAFGVDPSIFPKELSPFDPTNIQFTSGTTGSPKGATLSHMNILNNGTFCGDRMKLTEADRLCIPVPLYHCFGLVLGYLAAFTHGTEIVFPSSVFNAEKCLEAVSKHNCTGLHGVPTMFVSQLDHPKFESFRPKLSNLRTGIMAGSNCPIELMRKLITEMNMTDLTICYGMTETSPVSFQTQISDSLEQKINSVGSIHPHVECRVVDDEGNTVRAGQVGELHTKGYLVMKGYWNDPINTQKNIVDGWMHTGDLAVIQPDGYCQIVGRKKDMIIRGGENIFPREIEEYLFTHPEIVDVQIVGVPDRVYGEQVCAWIKKKSGSNLSEEGVKEFCRGKIAHYKVPHYFYFADEFPMTVTGKPQKFKMREISISHFGISS